MIDDDEVRNRIWQAELDLLQARYRDRLSYSLKGFIDKDEMPDELIWKHPTDLDPEIQRKLILIYNQIFR